MTVQEWIQLAQLRLVAVGVASPRLEAQVLAGHVLLVDRTWLVAHPEHEFPDLAGEVLLQRRESGEPLAYLTGAREFYGRKFRVTPAVLIPRQDTETLVEAALEATLPNTVRVLDIGTGSGCIAISLAIERPTWRVTGLDISPGALEVATTNAADLQAEIEWIESDLFERVQDRRFDLIVSNPPYIGRDELLSKEVRDFEPTLALFAEESGLSIYRKLAEQAHHHLTEGGLLMMEVGYQQASLVADLFHQNGWEVKEIVRDLCQIDRVVIVSPRHG